MSAGRIDAGSLFLLGTSVPGGVVFANGLAAGAMIEVIAAAEVLLG
jgi:hypothetical protein